MNDQEKIEAFDNLVEALTNRWTGDYWTWWCSSPCGGLEKRATQEEAIADLVSWAERIAKLKKRGK